MKQRADVLSLGAAMLLVLLAALVGPLDDRASGVGAPEPAMLSPNPSKAPWMMLGLFDFYVGYFGGMPTEEHVFTLD